MTRLKLAILISGRGSNMEAILEAARDPAYPAQPVLVLSNRPDAKGLETAAAAGIATAAIDHKTYGKDREAFERAMHEQLTEAGVEIIALAGFMRVLTPWFVNTWEGRMVNIHPSLLPKYKGLDTHQRALDAGDTEAGCTVHWVSPGVDDGEIIQQASLPILPGDTADSLAARLLPVEHRLYPEALTKACAEIQTRA
ncbi:phosphoribosylglycinamide formyltransferase [Hyphomonas sp.]|jgi:phosphoribosylglycinamide formyltransferase-1|uniref:phosphoribosylglycinamide formyltransferase n=3 Tax=unclassified Hyphomonas TaxID=2630699 RepID=UPI00261D6499|nr:phosphoribosylglycinamide formyltransferase [Hyphomonas sp.]MDF1805710.1 phosphoribosylglycinamide formyltransferase [Hyphomonas sp.]